ncbi:Mobile element protein [Sinorhizobium alkalisoli]|nr:Mobile element protein [Sinorhizobium alkalisoli]
MRRSKSYSDLCASEKTRGAVSVRSTEGVPAPSTRGVNPGGIWLVSFMQYKLGYIDLEQRTLQTIDNPFGTRLSPLS